MRDLQFEFVFLGLPGHPGEYRVKNTIVDTGADAFLKMMMQDDNSVVLGGANYYMGLCNQIPTRSDVLTSITTEPGATGGYARQVIPRSSVGFPTLITANGKRGIESTKESWTAVGADFDTAFSRAFLASTVDNTGTLLAYSGALIQPVTLLVGNTFEAYFHLYL